MNSPRDSSRVNPLTPCPVDKTNCSNRHVIRMVSSCQLTIDEGVGTHVTGRPIHGISSCDHLLSRSQNILKRSLGSLLDLIDTKDGTDVDSGINVTTSVKGVESHTVVSDQMSVLGVRADDDGVLL
jgi:hypothetical protein